MAKEFLIVLPVRNGGDHLRQCVQSVLAQTYQNFELAILDNASTDDNLGWLRGINDSRISVYPSSTPLSIEENWARIASLPRRQEYLTMTGHDDLFDPDFLEVICQLIEAQPNAALYQTHFRLIDGSNRKIRSCVPMPITEHVGEFLEARLSFRRDSFGTGYVFRFSDYLKVGGIPSFDKLLYADDVLWMKLMGVGYKATHRKECFSYRVHSGSTSYFPEWRPTYRAFSLYLRFLSEQSSKSASVKEALHDNLAAYVLYIFRWAHFTATKGAEDRRDLGVTISDLIPQVQALLRPPAAARFPSDVQRNLFGMFSFPRWMAWRALTWIRRRLAGMGSARID